MSKEAVQQFREAINLNTEWQEEVRTSNEPREAGYVVTFAKDKGYEFTPEDYTEYVSENVSGEISDFEMEMATGGAGGGG